jgi:hypothetical protein
MNKTKKGEKIFPLLSEASRRRMEDMEAKLHAFLVNIIALWLEFLL